MTNLRTMHTFLNISFQEINSSMLLCLVYFGDNKMPLDAINFAEFDEIDSEFKLHQKDLVMPTSNEKDDEFDYYLDAVKAAEKQYNNGIEIAKADVSIYDVSLWIRENTDENITFEDIEMRHLQTFVKNNWKLDYVLEKEETPMLITSHNADDFWKK